jgi:hypothetical protein
MDCLSLDAQVLMCEDCKLYPQEVRAGETVETWTLTNGMEIVPCSEHLNELEQEDFATAES